MCVCVCVYVRVCVCVYTHTNTQTLSHTHTHTLTHTHTVPIFPLSNPRIIRIRFPSNEFPLPAPRPIGPRCPAIIPPPGPCPRSPKPIGRNEPGGAPMCV